MEVFTAAKLSELTGLDRHTVSNTISRLRKYGLEPRKNGNGFWECDMILALETHSTIRYGNQHQMSAIDRIKQAICGK